MGETSKSAANSAQHAMTKLEALEIRITPSELDGIFKDMPESQRVAWVERIVTEIKEEGTINQIREIVNSPLLDD